VSLPWRLKASLICCSRSDKSGTDTSAFGEKCVLNSGSSQRRVRSA
jgi:hypothetical protein